MPIILDHINYIYSEKTIYEKAAIKDVSLVINEGEFIGIIGHTGSGKTTLVQHLNGLIKANDGHIYFNGEDVYDEEFDMKKLRSKVGLVFQYPEHQLFESTVYEDVSFGPKNLGLSGLELELRTYGALKAVGIGEDLIDASPFELSGGQKRRVAIAGVLAMEPEYLILDEPCAGLDPKGREEILELISSLRKEKNITIILISHSMEDVADYVDRLLVMDDGSLVMDDTPENVFARYKELEKMGLAAPQVTYVAQKLREKGMNIKGNPINIKQAKEMILKGIFND